MNFKIMLVYSTLGKPDLLPVALGILLLLKAMIQYMTAEGWKYLRK